MREYQIIVERFNGQLFYTAQYRLVYFLWRGTWRNILPMWQESIERAENQITNHQLFP